MALAVAQVGGNVTTSSGAISFTFGSSTTTGSLIAVVGHTYNTSGSAAGTDTTDNKSNTYSLAGAILGGASTPGVEVCYNNADTRGASHQCTYNAPGASESNNVGGIEITGQDASSPFDATTLGTASDSSSPLVVTAGGAITGNQIAIGGVTIDTGVNQSITDPAGYTPIIRQENGTTSLVSSCGYKINETGTPSIQWVTGGITAAREIFVTFKEGATVAASGSYGGTGLGRPQDPAWMWQQRYGVDPVTAVTFSVTGLLTVGTPAWTDATANRTSSGFAPIGAPVWSTVTADRTSSGFATVGPPAWSTITTTRTSSGQLEAGVPVWASASHDTSVSALLEAGIPAWVSAYLTGFPTTGFLPVGVPVWASASHDATTTAYLPAGTIVTGPVSHNVTGTAFATVGTSAWASVTHDATLTGLLEAGIVAWGSTSVPTDFNTTALLLAGVTAWTSAAVHNVTGTGLLEVGTPAWSTVTTTRASSGLIVVTATPTATVSHNAAVSGILPSGSFLWTLLASQAAPTLDRILTTTAVVDGRLVTVAVLDGANATQAIADGRAIATAVVDGQLVTLAIIDGRRLDT